MAENTANHGDHFNESIVNEVILEDMKKNRIDHMKYLPGMEGLPGKEVPGSLQSCGCHVPVLCGHLVLYTDLYRKLL